MNKIKRIGKADSKEKLQELLLGYYRHLKNLEIPAYDYKEILRFLTTSDSNAKWEIPLTFAGQAFDYIASIIWDANEDVEEWEIVYSSTDTIECSVKIFKLNSRIKTYIVKFILQSRYQLEEDTLRKTAQFQALA